ncbi:MAG: type II toxin-antitoxin system VapC family toxin [Enterobacterales bacterium]|nr:type II toxin-antitoxin system VapC family toxin [Enterobacterales bacterium]
MKLFFDSSSYIKKFIEEPGSREIDDLLQKASTLALSIICLPEIMSALNRKVREGSLTENGYQSVKQQIIEDIHDIQMINLVPEVVENSIKLLENKKLRSLEALHITCALTWNTDLFISSDKRQIIAAENSGLKVHLVV